MKIVKQGDTHRITYVAKNFTTGLTDITGVAIDPTGSTTAIPWSGTDATAGFVELANGLYYYVWNSTGKTLGEWSFTADSTSKSNEAAGKVQVVDGDTLNDTPFEKLDTMLDTVVSEIQNATYGLSAIHDDLAVVDGNVDDIENIVGDGTYGNQAIKTAIDAIQTSVSGISNSTRNTWTSQSTVAIPDSGSITRRIWMSIFDGTGAPEDPNSDQIQVQVFNAAGTDVTSSFIGTSPQYMTKDSVGNYYIDYTVESTDTEDVLRFKHTYTEGTDTIVRDGVVTLVAALAGDLEAQLNDIEAKIDTIDGIVDTINTNTDSLEAGQATIEGKIDTIDTVVDSIQVDTNSIETKIDTIDSEVGAIQTDVTAIDGKIDTIDTVVDAVKAVTDNLPDSGALTSIAQESTLGTPAGASVSADIAAIQSDVDTIETYLEPGGYLI